jgi:hypothetical protein
VHTLNVRVAEYFRYRGGWRYFVGLQDANCATTGCHTRSADGHLSNVHIVPTENRSH